MAEFIGARISLVSNSDIRYVGTLHEINSETSTVALENVSMLGTEGRRPENEVAPLDSVYEYILFRGTDVKDLRIEEAPAAKENKTQQIPHDPAILGSRSRPVNPTQNRQQAPSQGLPGLPQATPYAHHPQYPNFYPPPAIWGRGGPPGLGGFPSMPYGVPPNWHPGSQEYATGPQFTPYNYPHVPHSQFPQQNFPPKHSPSSVPKNKQSSNSIEQSEKNDGKQVEIKNILPQPTEISAAQVQKPPLVPITTKSSTTEDQTSNILVSKPLTAITKTTSDNNHTVLNNSKTKSHIQPALPLISLTSMKDHLNTKPRIPTDKKLVETSLSLRGATEAAAAVTAAMAKLPTAASQNAAAEILANKVSEMGISDTTKVSKQSSRPNTVSGRINRGGSSRGAMAKVEVPKEDFDFESANAKFSKHDLVKEVIAGTPLGEKAPEGILSNQNSAVSYNKAMSFFDNISSEAKDREESGSNKPGGREWRGEEQRKNLETFGQESVDNSFRGGYRNRGRGRGGLRGRGHLGKRPSTRGKVM